MGERRYRDWEVVQEGRRGKLVSAFVQVLAIDFIAQGVIPLVIDVESADIMSTLLVLKAEVENRIGSAMRVVFAGASEAPLLAREIVRARVGVILTPARPVPMKWEGRRVYVNLSCNPMDFTHLH